MYSLTICFGPQGTIWNLLFKTKEKAHEAHKMLLAPDMPILSFEDDFGQRITLTAGQIHGLLLEDLDMSQLGQIERGLHNARSQAKAQQRAMGDPIIKQSAMMQGPAVHSPFPNGRFNG